MVNHSGGGQVSHSSDKLLAIIECIAENRVPIRLQELAEKSGVTQSTALRYLRTLQNANYVYQDETTLRYALTWKLCALTENLNSYLGLRNIASPFVNHLANTLNAGACLVVERDFQCLYLDCIDHPRALYTPLQYIGKQAPLHATGSGKLLLSALTEAQVDEYITVKGLKPYTKYTITDPVKLAEELKIIRKRGFAYDDQECELGLRCVSFPIYTYAGALYAAISVFGNADEMTVPDFQEHIHAQLRKAAETISLRLGWDHSDSE